MPGSHTVNGQIITKIKFQLLKSQLIKKYHKLPKKVCFFEEAAFWMAKEHYKFIHAYQKTAFYQVPAVPFHRCVHFILSVSPDWMQWTYSPHNTEYNINQVCLRK